MGAIHNKATATIAISGSVSGIIDIGAGAPCTILMPAAWDTASITLQGSADGTNFGNIYDSYGEELVITTAVDRFISLEPIYIAGARYLKIRSGTSGTPVVQTAERLLTVITRRGIGE